ncbi:CocE/NonD family hydrolase [Solimonas sp. K1W22B-7]|uniref:CocE/NonD family hydrolase n=1 Tax=Solimonas sp. K1W22B-7 TaxID=2303331 RepID=UPI0013C3F6A6|nr:CocE/NonD family hydrolase [Solimonas sp. K1W22B-7]
MNRPHATLVSAVLALLLAACGHASDPVDDVTVSLPPAPPDAPDHVNVVPPPPAPGQSRDGLSYDVYIQVPATGDLIAFTVFEPATVEAGKKYPLLLHGHGGGASRVTNKNDPQSAYSPFNDNVGFFTEHGYGVISMDQRGHGESGGQIRLMDPDYEGRDLLAILDWAENRLGWLAYGRSVDGRDPHNLRVGGIGGSYGGAFQMLLHDIDPRHRMDALVPEATWHDVRDALSPAGTVKTLWGTFLGLRLGTAGNGLDPFMRSIFVDGLLGRPLSPEQDDLAYYHSNAYFCNGRPVATNGGPGTQPLYPPRRPGKIHAMFFQGMRDTLFNFNEAYRNYQCYRQGGGDVRLLSYQAGHNATPVIPDPGGDLFQPLGHMFNSRCGSLSVHDAALAFFDEHLKGIEAAASLVPTQLCLSLRVDDAVLVDEVMTGHAGREAAVPAATVVAGLPELPTVVELGIVAGDNGDVLGGIPRLEIDIEPLAGAAAGEPVIFAGIGHKRALLPNLPLPLVWDLVDNQVMPIRGSGHHEIDLVGVGERLQPGDRLALLLYGSHDQYLLSGSVNATQPAVVPLRVSGRIWLPLLGPLPPAP